MKDNNTANILNSVNGSADVSTLKPKQLKVLADDIRAYIIECISQTGGHLGAGLGVVELTVALHKVFTTPQDKIIWDVGHQAYPHKVITGRKQKLLSIRQGGGLSGFTKRSESPDDCFGAGHSSTSISAGLGFAIARDLQHKDNHVVSVIGDGAMSAGLAFEGMNNAGNIHSRLLVILNDNDMSIAPPVGALSGYLSRIMSSHPWMKTRDIAKKLSQKMPDSLTTLASRMDEYTRGMVTGGTLFEELGFYYLGPVDGHRIDQLVPILENIRNMSEPRPILLHVVTQKGKGYPPAEKSTDKYHGVGKFCIKTGEQEKAHIPNFATYTQVFAESLTHHAENDTKIVAITAAMPDGTGLNIFKNAHPHRYFDVGIAEQHAVTFAGGLAADGLKPCVAIYSTFLQRAYDQIIHDVALQNLPVRFFIDRAGLVGADGASHAGMFDVAYLGCIPNMAIGAASNESELAGMVATAVAYNEGPIAIRYPRGNGTGCTWTTDAAPLPIGKAHTRIQGKKIAILNFGTRMGEVLSALHLIKSEGITPTVVDMRWAKPLDMDMLYHIFTTHDGVITIEEGTMCGFGALVLQASADLNILQHTRVKTLTLPDIFQNHDTPHKQYIDAKLDAQNIADTIWTLNTDV